MKKKNRKLFKVEHKIRREESLGAYKPFEEVIEAESEMEAYKISKSRLENDGYEILEIFETVETNK